MIAYLSEKACRIEDASQNEVAHPLEDANQIEDARYSFDARLFWRAIVHEANVERPRPTF